MGPAQHDQRAYSRRRLRVEGPDLFAGRGVDGVNEAPTVGVVHRPVHNQRRGLQAVAHRDGVCPGEAQAADGLAVDLSQRRETLLGVGAAVGDPGSRLVLFDAGDALVIDESRARRRRPAAGQGPGGRTTGRGGQNQDRQPFHGPFRPCSAHMLLRGRPGAPNASRSIAYSRPGSAPPLRAAGAAAAGSAVKNPIG